MAKISLRAYNRDIENLIDRGQTEEAIAQCRYILKFFPKHVETYRLLGKTYLESQRYTEASDMLQRVLSAVPDDFVSQLGMSIIREDEGNLDAAIWHMERAYEIQPSNTAVQDELRRLYGRRDGVEPPKVRLTRGALVRMYARGDLYPQAIAEARAALAEAPHRIDIETILARMYFLSGQKVEATEVASRLVAKLPYCLEANRILAEILPETSHAEDAKGFQQAVAALDPYYNFISPAAPTSDMVPDNAVTLEHMEWEPGAEVPEQPAWANAIGVKLEQGPDDDVPDWLSAIRVAKAADQEEEPEQDLFAEEQAQEPATSSAEQPSTDEQPAAPETLMPEAEPASEADIPDWMRAAGWAELNGTEQEPPPVSFDEEEEIGTGEPIPADIPDWLKSLAPDEEEPAAGDLEQERLDMLASLLPQTEAETPTEEPAAAAETEPVAAQEEEPDQAEEAQLPDWLREMEMTSSETTIIGPDDELSKWLAEGVGEATEDQAKPEEQSVEAAPEPEAPQAVESPAEAEWTAEMAEETPWQAQADTTAIPSEESVLPSGAEDLDAAMAWLESLAAQHGADEETLITKPEDRLSEPPGWVREEADHPEDEEGSEAASLPEGEIPGAAAAGAMAFQIEEPDEAEPEMAAGAQVFPISEEPAEDLLETPEAALGAQAFEMPNETVQGAQAFEIPEEPVSGAQAFEAPQEAVEETEPASAEVPQAPEAAFASTPDFSDEAAAFAWLESLAAQQGAEEETLLNKPEDRLETPPEWVQEEAQEELQEETTAPTMPVESAEAQPAAEGELPAWLDEIAREEIAPVQGKKEDELLDWFDELNAEPAETVETPAAPAPVEEAGEAVQAEEIPEWLRALEQEEGVTPDEAPEEVPEWLQEVKTSSETAGFEELGIASEPDETEQAVPPQEEKTQPVAVQTEAVVPEAETQEITVEQSTTKEPEAVEPSVEAVEEAQPEPETPERVETQPVALEAAAEEEQPEAGVPIEDLFPSETIEATQEIVPPETVAETQEITPTEALEKPQAEAEPEVVREPQAEAEPEVVQEPQAEAEPEAVEEPQAEAEPEVAEEPQAEIQPEMVEEPPVEVLETPGVEEAEPQPEFEQAAQPVAEPEPQAAPATAEPAGEDRTREQALADLDAGRTADAVEKYNHLIESDQMLEEVIQDLRNSLYRYPVDVSLWQALGDAYLRNNQIQDALDSYTKAEELLR